MIHIKSQGGFPMKDDMPITRRGALKVGATLAAGVAAGLSDADAAENLRRFERQSAVDSKDRILLKGGTIISMDAKVGDLVQGDVLIEGKKIAAIAPTLNAAGAQVIDAHDTSILPGSVDCHRHSWEAPLRRINPNSPTLADYSNATHLSFAKAYRPQDHYAANYLTAVGCIDAGITCVIDNSHNSRSADHSHPAAAAVGDHPRGSCHPPPPPNSGDWAPQWPPDFEPFQKKYFSSHH